MNKLKAFFGTKAGKALSWVLSLVPVVLALLLAGYYIVGPGQGYFHSDCSDSLYWANASVEAGSMFDETFRYAGLLPFSASLWMIPLIRIFGFGMTAHNIAMLIFAVLFAASIWFCCASAGFGKGWCGGAVFAVFMLLSSSDKLREILWGHTIYYSVGLITLFAGVGLALQMLRALREKKQGKAIVFTLLTVLLAAGCGTDGMQVIVLGMLPVAGALVAEWLFDGTHSLLSRRSLASVLSVCAVGFGVLIGLFVLKVWKGDSISAGYADAYSGWSGVEEWANNALAFVKQYFSLIGAEPEDAETLFAKASLGAIIRIGVGAVILLVPIVMLCFYRKLSGTGIKVLLWAHFIGSAAILFGFICGRLSGANWRLTPLFGSAALVTFCGARELCHAGAALLRKNAATDAEAPAAETPVPAEGTDRKEPVASRTAAGRVCIRLGALLCAALLCAAWLSANEIRKMPADYGRDNYNHRLAAFLEDKGLEYGYGTFWYCQSVTVISESKVKCREVLADRAGGVYSDYYQSSRTWYVNQSYEKFFVLLSDYEYSLVSQSVMWQQVAPYQLTQYRAAGPEDETAGLGVQGFVITVFDRNILDPAVLETN